LQGAIGPPGLLHPRAQKPRNSLQMAGLSGFARAAEGPYPPAWCTARTLSMQHCRCAHHGYRIGMNYVEQLLAP
jgi:hypothetical protein